MKIDEDKLVFEDYKNRLEIHFSPQTTKSNWDPRDLTLAKILSWSKSFTSSVIEAREKINIKASPYPQKNLLNELIEIFPSLITTDQWSLLTKESEIIANRFNLTENWHFPIETAILFNTLLIPPKEGISIHFPSYFFPEEQKPKKLSEIGGSLFHVPFVIRYPAIYFTRQTSINELKKWINDNRELLRNIQYKLPKPKILKIKEDTIFWGQIAWIFRKEKISWAKMPEKIEQENKRYLKEAGKSEDNEEDYLDIPLPLELEKYYERFLKAIEKNCSKF